jgi:hypothetical protein
MSNLKTNATAGAPTPNGRERSSAFQNARTENTQFVGSATPQIDLDARLDDLIAIADLTGATLDDVVRIVGHLPEAIFTAAVDVLATLAAPPAPTALTDLLREHRFLSDEIGRAVKDSVITDAEIQRLDRKLEEIEAHIVAAPARTAAMAYAKLLTVFPELRCDLQLQANATLQAEIDSLNGGEV